jgi:YfiH family protein
VLSLGSLGVGVRYAYTTRAGGYSKPPYDGLNLSFHVGDEPAAVAANRTFVLDRLGVDSAVWLRAQHGAGVVVVDASTAPDPEVDVLVTREPNLAVAALSADCALVVLADPAAGVIGVAHCGRPGLLAGTVPAAVAALRRQGAIDLVAAIGPAVCGACYPVPQAMADEVVAAVPAAAARTPDGRPALDVAAGVAAQLEAAGAAVVRRVGGCTREDPALFSYRRDHRTGRLGALVWRSERHE